MANIALTQDKHLTKIYPEFLQKNAALTSAVELSRVDAVSHDQVTRFLADNAFTPHDLWVHVRGEIDKTKGWLIIDDTVIEKPYGPSIELTGWYYSSTQNKVIWGIPVVTLVWSDGKRNYPIDYRVHQPMVDEKDKNVLFREMLRTAKNRGFTPDYVVFDGWYASLVNLKLVEKLDWVFVSRVRKNRQVSVGTKPNQRIDTLDWSHQTAPQAYVKGFGLARIIRTVLLNHQGAAYLMTNALAWRIKRIIAAYKRRWIIEPLFRVAKQVLSLGACQARRAAAQRNHIFFAFCALAQTEKRRIASGLSSYEQRALVFRGVTRTHLGVIA